MSYKKIIFTLFFILFAMNCSGPYNIGPAPEEPMYDAITGKAKFQLNGCLVCEIPKNKTEGLTEGDKVNVHLPTSQMDNERYIQFLADMPDKMADALGTSSTYMTTEEKEDAEARDIPGKLQSSIVEALQDRGIDAIAGNSKNGNYMTIELLSYTSGNKWLRFLDYPGLRIVLWLMGEEYNSDLSVKWNLHMSNTERDFNLFKHKDNDPRGFFGLFKDADKRNLHFAAKKISKSVIKKDK